MVNGPNIVALNIGNTRTQIGLFVDGQLTKQERLVNTDLPALIQQVVSWWSGVGELDGAAILIASVNEPVAERVRSALADQLSTDVYRVGMDVPVPIGRQLDPETITGIDRLLNAAAAYDILKQACVVVDVGTAATVDFVDGEGTYHGGAIAPGAQMQLNALHEHTAALPEIEFKPPHDDTFGRSTGQAMLHGVFHGIRGMVWKLVENYALKYGAYPTVIATGGDAELIFRDDDLVDRIVPELTLLGIATAAKHALASDAE